MIGLLGRGLDFEATLVVLGGLGREGWVGRVGQGKLFWEHGLGKRAGWDWLEVWLGGGSCMVMVWKDRARRMGLRKWAWQSKAGRMWLEEWGSNSCAWKVEVWAGKVGLEELGWRGGSGRIGLE